MAGFNDNSITIQWTPQSLNGYRVDGYYLEKIGTQEMIWQGSADTTQVTVQAKRIFRIYKTGIQTYKSCHRKNI